jgi:hypothetical protein
MGLFDNLSSAYTTAKTAVTQSVNNVKDSINTPNAPNLWTPRGRTSALDDGKYDIKNHSYPNDLMAADSRYGGSYVMFYINVATDSKLITKHKAETVDDYSPRDRGDLVAMNMSKEGLTGSVAAVSLVEAAAAGGLLAGAKGVATGAAAAGVATVGVGVTTSLAPDAKRSQKRLKTAIALHIPNQLSVRYGVQWSDEDTSALAMANAGGTEILKAIQDDKKSDVTGVGAAIIANLALSKGPQAAGVSAATGLASNPKKEQVFKGVDFRSFSFEYQFFPRDVDEANNVLRIIEEFKYHMHPEFKDTNNFVYIYPSEFDIVYFVNGKENRKIHRHTSCVLTDININYTPNGVFTTFPNGMPTQINMTLNFRELALLTKDKIKDGL